MALPYLLLYPCSPQLSEFFRLDDSDATVTLTDLIILNSCASILMPDPKVMPSAVFGQVSSFYPILFSR